MFSLTNGSQRSVFDASLHPNTKNIKVGTRINLPKLYFIISSKLHTFSNFRYIYIINTLEYIYSYLHNMELHSQSNFDFITTQF